MAVAVAAAVADAPVQSIDFVVDSLLHLPIDWFVAAAVQRAVHAPRAANDSEYASADESVAAVVAAVAAHARRRHSDEVEIASDWIRSMICDSDLDDSVDLSFVIAVGCRASNGSASVRLSCVDTMHFDPFVHAHSPRAVPVGPVDAGSWHSDRSRRTFVCLAALVAHPDTLDALHSANNAVAVVVAASVASVVDSNYRTLAVASSCPVAMGIAFSVVLVAYTATCAGDRRRPQRPPIAVFAIAAVLVVASVDARSPLRPPMDTALPVHCSVLPSRPDHPARLHRVRPHADRPYRTYCRRAFDTSDTAIVAEIVAMDVVLDVGHMHRAAPLDVPQLQSHHIDSMHLYLSEFGKQKTSKRTN